VLCDKVPLDAKGTFSFHKFDYVSEAVVLSIAWSFKGWVVCPAKSILICEENVYPLQCRFHLRRSAMFAENPVYLESSVLCHCLIIRGLFVAPRLDLVLEEMVPQNPNRQAWPLLRKSISSYKKPKPSLAKSILCWRERSYWQPDLPKVASLIATRSWSWFRLEVWGLVYGLIF
jgi:hypothetical protein